MGEAVLRSSSLQSGGQVARGWEFGTVGVGELVERHHRLYRFKDKLGPESALILLEVTRAYTKAQYT